MLSITKKRVRWTKNCDQLLPKTSNSAGTTQFFKNMFQENQYIFLKFSPSHNIGKKGGVTIWGVTIMSGYSILIMSILYSHFIKFRIKIPSIMFTVLTIIGRPDLVVKLTGAQAVIDKSLWAGFQNYHSKIFKI